MRYLPDMKFLKFLGLFAFIAILLSGFINTSCSGVASRQNVVDSLFLYLDDADIYYDLKDPERKYFLPYALSEVSGLTYMEPSTLLMVEDEGGEVYEYNLDSSKIVNSTRFTRSGDFEGIELVNDTVYVLESNGKIYKFAYTKDDIAKAQIFKTPLDERNNTEGLGYDPALKKLLIATKEDGDYKKHKVKGRAVYSVNPSTGVMDSADLFSISTTTLTNFFEKVKNQPYEKERFKFEPSSIAYNPIDKNYYVLASVGKLLMVVNKQGEIVSSYPILPRVLNQPEGICFAPNGDMYICSEGEGDKGFVLHFKMFKK
jgi:uncharacterized protein YjiK